MPRLKKKKSARPCATAENTRDKQPRTLETKNVPVPSYYIDSFTGRKHNSGYVTASGNHVTIEDNHKELCHNQSRSVWAMSHTQDNQAGTTAKGLSQTRATIKIFQVMPPGGHN
jgi:hypothetical protein